ncbi:MAG: hypothetical protein LBC60_07045 [Spirochaetaceae bacterium]|jgi:hypothetical protein|nr:hypothetical protein [Spirochaetaceae bacterium]
MFKKSLIIGSVMPVLLVLFALAGCSNPTDTGLGPLGTPAPLTLGGPVSASALTEHFTDNDVIRLITNGSGAAATTVTGTVTAGKTLEIAGYVEIKDSLTIENGGAMHILEDGVLDAKKSGGLSWGSAGALSIDGDLALAYDEAERIFGEAWPARFSFGPNGAVDLDNEGTAAQVDFLFSKGVPAVVSSVLTTLGGTEPDITAWEGSRKLVLSSPVTTTYDVDFSGRGILVIRNSLTLGQDTGAYQHALRSSGGGGISIAKANPRTGRPGVLLLNQSVLPTTMGIKVEGVLSTNKPITTKAIPANVDLSAATLRASASGSGTSTFTFGSREVIVNKIELTNNPLAIAGETAGNQKGMVNLSVKTVTNSAAATTDTLLTLPAGATVVERIIPTARNININGGRYAVLSPLSITNGTVRLAGSDLVLSGKIGLAPLAVLALASNNNLGSDRNAQMTQLENIIGGAVNAAGLHFTLTRGTYYTSLSTSGDLKVSGTVSFASPHAVISVNSVFAEDGPALINGKSRMVVAGNLVVSDDITFDNSGGVFLNGKGNTIAHNKSIIVGPQGSVNMGNKLSLTRGVYTAQNPVTINALSGTITTAGVAAGDGLVIAPTRGDTANAVTLLSDGPGAATFTALGGDNNKVPVVFGGKGITISRGATAGAVLTVSGAAPAPGVVTVKGSSVITLESGNTPASKGALQLLDGAKLGGEASGDYYVADHSHYVSPGVYDGDDSRLWAMGSTANGNRVIITAYTNPPINGVFDRETVKKP